RAKISIVGSWRSSRRLRFFQPITQAAKTSDHRRVAELRPQYRDMHLDGVRRHLLLATGHGLLDLFLRYDLARTAHQAFEHQPFARGQFDLGLIDEEPAAGEVDAHAIQ